MRNKVREINIKLEKNNICTQYEFLCKEPKEILYLELIQNFNLGVDYKVSTNKSIEWLV